MSISRLTMVAVTGVVAMSAAPLAASVATAALPAATTTWISMTNRGTVSDGASYAPAVSGDGRYVAFASEATNLVAGDTNEAPDVFVRDRQAQTLRRVDVSSSGAQALGGSQFGNVVISTYGRYVAYSSDATNLVPGDTNKVGDVFLRDRQTGTTSRISISSAGKQANGPSFVQAISSTGRFIVFTSDASNLVSGDTNGKRDIFVRDRQTGRTSRVNLGPAGVQANAGSTGGAISADGRYVAFASYATNLVSGDTNNARDVFVRDRQTGTTRRISVSSAGKQANKSSDDSIDISGNGRYVAFSSDATNLVSGDTNGYTDAFVRDLQAAKTTRVSLTSSGVQADDSSFADSVSADGRYVAFTSFAVNLSPDFVGVLSVYVRDRSTGTTSLVGRDSTGASCGECYDASISADGRYVAFTAEEPPLVPGDTNDTNDVYLRGPLY